MKNKGHALLKPDCLDLKEMRDYTVDVILSSDLIILKRKLWRLNEKEFFFLRRDSLNKSYFEELKKTYCNQTHELIQLDLTRLPQKKRYPALNSVRNTIREQYAINALINGLHIPNSQESLVEDFFYEMILKQK